MKILNRIVIFALGLSVIPIMYFRNLIRIVVSLNTESSVYTILSSIISDTADKGMEITFSIKKIVGYITDGTLSIGDMDFDLSKIPTDLLTNKNWVIASAVFLIIAILIGIVTAGCGLLTKAYKTIMCLSAGGVACTFAAIKCFSHFTAPFLSGDMDVGQLLGQALIGDGSGLLGTIGTAILNNSIDVDSFCFDSAIFTMLVIFIVMLLWSVAYYVTLPEKDKIKKIK